MITQLKSIRFLDTGQGRLTAPADAYIRSDQLVAALGERRPVRHRHAGDRAAAAGLPDRAARGRHPHEPREAAGVRARREPARYRVPGAGCGAAAGKTGRLANCGTTRSSGRVTGGRRPATAWSARTTATPSSTRSPCSRMPCATTGYSSAPIGDRPMTHWVRLLVGLASDTAPGSRVPPRFADALRRAYRNLGRLPEGPEPGTRLPPR